MDLFSSLEKEKKIEIIKEEEKEKKEKEEEIEEKKEEEIEEEKEEEIEKEEEKKEEEKEKEEEEKKNDIAMIVMNHIVDNQLTKISETIIKIKKQLFIAIVAYDENYKSYYILTLQLFYLSSVVTFIEALRLIIIEYVNKSDQLWINVNLLSTIINALVLFSGIMITVLTSIVRFRNYREILEKLREKQNIMIEYIDKYKKQRDNLDFVRQTKNIKIEEIEKIKNDIAKYDTILVSTNIIEFLTTTDLIRYNKYKIKFDKKMKKLKEEDDAEEEDEDFPSRYALMRGIFSSSKGNRKFFLF